MSWSERRAEKRRQKMLTHIAKTRETNPELSLHEYLFTATAEEDRRNGVLGRQVGDTVPVGDARYVTIPVVLEGPEVYASPTHGGVGPTRVFVHAALWLNGSPMLYLEPRWVETGVTMHVGPFPIELTVSSP